MPGGERVRRIYRSLMPGRDGASVGGGLFPCWSDASLALSLSLSLSLLVVCDGEGGSSDDEPSCRRRAASVTRSVSSSEKM